jgi:hypothetical protein
MSTQLGPKSHLTPRGNTGYLKNLEVNMRSSGAGAARPSKHVVRDARHVPPQLTPNKPVALRYGLRTKIDGRQGIDIFGICVYQLLTDLPSIHYSFSFWACRNSSD